MGTLTPDGGAPFPVPQLLPGADPKAMASFKQAQALAGGPPVQAQNFAVTTGENALQSRLVQTLEQRTIAAFCIGRWTTGASPKLCSHNWCKRWHILCYEKNKRSGGCTGKVFCDNYLDGGYHVLYAHGGLASGLQLQSYETLTYERVSVQTCESAPAEQDDFDRLGTKAIYGFVYPNFMINRYGPWMDTNLAVTLDATRCKVVFDYFPDKSLLDDQNFIERSLKDSEQVQKHSKPDDAKIKKTRKDLQNRLDYLRKQTEGYDDKGPVINVVAWHDGDVWRVAVDTQATKNVEN